MGLSADPFQCAIELVEVPGSVVEGWQLICVGIILFRRSVFAGVAKGFVGGAQGLAQGVFTGVGGAAGRQEKGHELFGRDVEAALSVFIQNFGAFHPFTPEMAVPAQSSPLLWRMIQGRNRHSACSRFLQLSSRALRNDLLIQGQLFFAIAAKGAATSLSEGMVSGKSWLRSCFQALNSRMEESWAAESVSLNLIKALVEFGFGAKGGIVPACVAEPAQDAHQLMVAQLKWGGG